MNTPEQSPLLEAPVDGSDTLYIMFGGRKAGMGLPQFEFCKAANILNHNKLFIRDLRQTWYQCGLPGISKSLAETVRPLRQIVERYDCKNVVTIGNSMGGFAAIYFAAALGRAHAIAFAPQTFIGPVKRLRHRDKRWNREILRLYAKTLFRRKQFSLIDAIQTQHQADWKADIVVAADHRLDLIHARELKTRNEVTIRKYPGSSHRIVRDLRSQGYLSKILQGDFSGSMAEK